MKSLPSHVIFQYIKYVNMFYLLLLLLLDILYFLVKYDIDYKLLQL